MTDRIIVLDGHALNPGDLDWSPFAGLGSLELHERTPEADIVTRAGGAGFVLLNKTPMSRATLARLPALRYIGVLATGYNVVDLQAAREQGITVTNIPTYGTDSVAQHAAAMMLEYSFGMAAEARNIWAAMQAVFADGFSTPDLTQPGVKVETIGTEAFGDKVVAKLRAAPRVA